MEDHPGGPVRPLFPAPEKKRKRKQAKPEQKPEQKPEPEPEPEPEQECCTETEEDRIRREQERKQREEERAERACRVVATRNKVEISHFGPTAIHFTFKGPQPWLGGKRSFHSFREAEPWIDGYEAGREYPRELAEKEHDERWIAVYQEFQKRCAAVEAEREANRKIRCNCYSHEAWDQLRAFLSEWGVRIK